MPVRNLREMSLVYWDNVSKSSGVAVVTAMPCLGQQHLLSFEKQSVEQKMVSG